MTRYLLIVLLILAGCAQLPPPPGDAAAKKFEIVPDRSVIYVARHVLDKDFAAPIMLDGAPIGTTYNGTFMRIVVPAGAHRITGFAGDSGSIQLKTEPGKLYFINQSVSGFRSLDSSTFQLVDAKHGRTLVLNGILGNEIIH